MKTEPEIRAEIEKYNFRPTSNQAYYWIKALEWVLSTPTPAQGEEEEVIEAMTDAYDDVYEATITVGDANWRDNKPQAMSAAFAIAAKAIRERDADIAYDTLSNEGLEFMGRSVYAVLRAQEGTK